MRASRNLVAGIANSAWTAVVGIAVVPFYLHYLGLEAYGLIGFFATLQAVLRLLDFGLAPTINREIARCRVAGDHYGAAELLHTLAVVYWITAGAIALVVLFLSSWVSASWLSENELSEDTLVAVVMLMGVVVAARWPVGLYQGALMGAERITVSSGISMLMVGLANIGGIFVLAFISPDIISLFVWHLVVAIVFAFAMRLAAWNIIGRQPAVSFSARQIKRVWKFAAGMAGVAVTGTLFMQLDKIVLSKMVGLDDFGLYTLAATLAMGMYVVLTPVFNVIYPRMSSLVASSDTSNLLHLYRVGSRTLNIVIFPLAATGAFFAEDILFVWTGERSVSEAAAPIFSFLLLGTAVNGTMHFPYALQLAHGKSRLPFMINLLLMLLFIPLLLLLVPEFGAVGGAISWLVLNVLYLFVGSWITHRNLLVAARTDWLLFDVILPALISVAVVAIGTVLIKGMGFSSLLNSIFAIMLSLFTIVGIVSLNQGARVVACSGWRNLR
jgi:O-antigen/teichoic acid export membrane protein